MIKKQYIKMDEVHSPEDLLNLLKNNSKLYITLKEHMIYELTYAESCNRFELGYELGTNDKSSFESSFLKSIREEDPLLADMISTNKIGLLSVIELKGKRVQLVASALIKNKDRLKLCAYS